MNTSIGVVGFSFPASYNLQAAKAKIIEAFDEIASCYSAGREFTVVLNYLGKGACFQACELAKQRGWRTECIVSREAYLIRRVCTVNKSKTVGSKFGDEIPELVKACDVMIRIGGDKYAQEAIRQFKKQYPNGRVFEYDLQRLL